MKVKIVKKVVSSLREDKIIDSGDGISVPFGLKDEFDLLQVEIFREKDGSTVVYEINSHFLPTNKSNTTRFRLKSCEKEGTEVVWCRKVASNFKKL